MRFKLVCDDGAVVCTKDNLLRTVEQKEGITDLDLTRVVSFLATAREGSETRLSIGYLIRMEDPK